MKKTSILLALFTVLAAAPVALGYGAQDCSAEAQHLWVAATQASAYDGTGALYAVTGALSGVTGPSEPTKGDWPAASLAFNTRAMSFQVVNAGGIGLSGPDSTSPVSFGPATNEVFVAVVGATDSNVLGDCNGDGQPGDFDGDLDVSWGGFFFGSGATWEALCGYGYNVHATTGGTSDSAGLPYRVSIGIDDPNGPTPPVFDPVTNREVQGCQTDGVISASPDSTPSADGDCLQAYAGNGAYLAPCGGIGGDDGYWGFVDPGCNWPPVHCEASIAGIVTVTF